MLVDSHCHLDCLDLTLYDTDMDGIIAGALEQGVEYILSAGTTLEGFPNVLDIAERYANVVCSVGVQPQEQAREPEVEELVQLCTNDNVVGIGETGLDYHYDFVAPEVQRERFARHIVAALSANKPLIVHSRAAQSDILGLMESHHASEVGGVIHCFTEDYKMAKAALDLNFYISFSGILTFKNAGQLREVARKVPLDRILIETDAPYLAPVPLRGKPNQPAYLPHVAECLAEVRNESLDVISAATTANFFRLFTIPDMPESL